MVEKAQSLLLIWLCALPLTTTARTYETLDSSLLESDGVGGDVMGDVAADEADDVRGEGQNDESSVPEDIASDSDSEPALPVYP